MLAFRTINKVALTGLISFCSPATSWSQTTIQLTPNDNLASAITAAGPGDILELQGGDYGVLEITKAGGKPGQPITIRSSDVRNPARLSEIDLREVTYLVIDGLVFDYEYSFEDKPNARPFQIFTTRGLVIQNRLHPAFNLILHPR